MSSMQRDSIVVVVVVLLLLLVLVVVVAAAAAVVVVVRNLNATTRAEPAQKNTRGIRAKRKGAEPARSIDT